jgi:hypothetical protein
MPSGKVVSDTDAVGKHACRLRQLDVILRAEDGLAGHVMADCERSEIDDAADANEANVGLAAVGINSILYGQKDRRVKRIGGVGNDNTSRVMERLDDEVLEVTLMLLEEIFPVEDLFIDDGGAVELNTKGVKNETCIHREGFECCTSDLKGMSALVHRHGGLDLGVHSGRVAAVLNRDQVTWDKSRWGGRRFIGADMVEGNSQKRKKSVRTLL